MNTALLPIRIEQNLFWSSSRGFECIEKFLATVRISNVHQFVVITHDDRVCQLARKWGMDVSDDAIPGRIDQPYTFEQSLSLARVFKNQCKNEKDALIIIDHRNLMLSADAISMANYVFEQNPENGVISLSYCRDHPCQLRSFFSFFGCDVLHTVGMRRRMTNSNKNLCTFHAELNCFNNELGEISAKILTDGSTCNLSFCGVNLPFNHYIAQILPFDQNGPQFEKTQEILVNAPYHEKVIKINTSRIKGIIFIFLVPSQSGEYNTVEFFTPKNASWELGESTSVVYGKRYHEPIHSRQQFVEAYTYDGSICILNRKGLGKDTLCNPFPFLLKESCMVADWVDYWYIAASKQPTSEPLIYN